MAIIKILSGLCKFLFVNEKYNNVRWYIKNNDTLLLRGEGDLGYYDKERGDWFLRNVTDDFAEDIDKKYQEDYITSNKTPWYSERESVKKIDICDSITSIGDNFFRGFTSLEFIYLSKTLIYIGIAAFAGCKNLKIISLPNSLISISEYAFKDCTSLTKVLLESDSAQIPSPMFKSSFVKYFADLIKKNGFKEYRKNMTEIKFYSGNLRELARYYLGVTDPVNSFGMPDSFMEEERLYRFVAHWTLFYLKRHIFIGKSAFEGCTSLTEITMPSQLKSIGNSAFKGCTSLTTVKLPATVEDIGDGVFEGCTNLETIYYPEGAAFAEKLRAGNDVELIPY